MTRIIEPSQGVVLVRLPTSEYGNIVLPEKNYDSVTWGEIIGVNPIDAETGIMRPKVKTIGHWRQFKDDVRIADGDDILALIEIKDILGVEYETE